ncbi:putative fumarate hydratase [Citrobacter koseri]|uniref:Putative fumarate hydratase n=1 Tax=Citrobacter koseri TaxID=545 RepID=A0A2X2URJ1_CITKO|nr:putative fumarate hydratase [Citrobacter koseri]
MMEVKNLPAFVLVDDKGNNFFSQFEQQHRWRDLSGRALRSIYGSASQY